jgi:hypothetical protein
LNSPSQAGPVIDAGVVEETTAMTAMRVKVIDGDSNGEELSARLRSQRTDDEK